MYKTLHNQHFSREIKHVIMSLETNLVLAIKLTLGSPGSESASSFIKAKTNTSKKVERDQNLN